MPKVLRVRALSDEECQSVERLTHSRTEAARLVERARIVWASHQGQHVPAIAAHLHLTPVTVRLWIKRFNAQGADGFKDEARSGRPATYTPEQVGEVIAAALSKPTTLGLPFGSWTLDRLEVYLNEEKGLPIKRTRIDELLIDEGLRWRTQETWFGERAGRESPPRAAESAPEKPVDPDFAEKRGRLRPSIPRRRQKV